MTVPGSTSEVRPQRKAVTGLVIGGVIVVVGIPLFRSPMPVITERRVIGQELASHGGYAPWRAAVIVAIILVLAIWAGFRRTPLVAAWAAAVGAGVVPLVVAALNPSRAGADVSAVIGVVSAALVAGMAFLGVAVVATVVDVLLTRHERRSAGAPPIAADDT